MNGRVGIVLIGPPEHGAVEFGRRLAEDLSTDVDRPAAPPVVVCAPTVADLLADAEALDRLAGVDTAHLQFTDQLFAGTCDEAARAYGHLVGRLTEHGNTRVSVTLHDLPVAEADVGRYERRAQAYREVVRVTTGVVVVCSHHEAGLLRDAGVGDPVVIALPVNQPALPDPRPDRDGEVTMLGFVYPGKGHAEAIDALADLPAHVGLTALGRAADAHDDLVEQLRRAAATRSRRFTLTGYLPEPELITRLQAAAIPLAGHRAISASASIASWVGAGRRPLVPDGRYTREFEARCPGAVTRFEPTPAGLAEALAWAWADPDSTWLAPDVRLQPSRVAVAMAYRRAWTGSDRR